MCPNYSKGPLWFLIPRLPVHIGWGRPAASFFQAGCSKLVLPAYLLPCCLSLVSAAPSVDPSSILSFCQSLPPLPLPSLLPSCLWCCFCYASATLPSNLPSSPSSSPSSPSSSFPTPPSPTVLLPHGHALSPGGTVAASYLCCTPCQKVYQNWHCPSSSCTADSVRPPWAILLSTSPAAPNLSSTDANLPYPPPPPRERI